MNRFALGSGRTRVATVLAIALTLFAGVQAKSADIYGNYGTGAINNGSLVLVGWDNAEQHNHIIAQGFRVNGISWDLVNVEVPVDNFDGLWGTPQMQLRQANGSNPGAVVATFTNPATPPIGVLPQWYTFTLAAPVTLNINTNYFIVLSDLQGNSTDKKEFHWHETEPFTVPSGQGGSGLTYVSTLSSTDGEVTWSGVNPSIGIRLNAVPVPEPSTYALGAIGVLTLGIVSKRRKRANA